MNNQFTMILGVLVWNKLLTKEHAERLKRELGARPIPGTIDGVVKELESVKDE